VKYYQIWSKFGKAIADTKQYSFYGPQFIDAVYSYAVK